MFKWKRSCEFGVFKPDLSLLNREKGLPSLVRVLFTNFLKSQIGLDKKSFA
jgi:hypothetical protein